MIKESWLTEQISVLKHTPNRSGTNDFVEFLVCISARVQEGTASAFGVGPFGKVDKPVLKIWVLPGQGIEVEHQIRYGSENRAYTVDQVFNRKDFSGPHHTEILAVQE